ncbi:MAG: type IX secretion system membrane protein PorP/SprF [Mangrovibacterium sp.]
MSKKTLIALILLQFCLVVQAQQDPQFTFYKEAELLYNPAIAGASREVHAAFLNRNQWSGLEGAPTTMLFSVDSPMDFLIKNSGLGFNVMRDELGFESTTLFMLDFSYRLEQKWGMMGFGFSLGMFNKDINGEWTVPEGSNYSSGDDLLPEGEVSEVAFDAGIGAFLKVEKLYLSLGLTHVNQAEIMISDKAYTFYKRHYHLQGSYRFNPLSEKIRVEPSFLYKGDFSGSQLDLNADVHYKDKFAAGLGYRMNDGIIIRIKTQLKNGISVGYAYDLTTSALAAYSSGSHEFYVAYSFAFQKPKAKAYKSVRYL